MTWKHRLFAASFALLPLFADAGVFDGKTPAYFVDLYGPAKSSRAESSHPFVHVGRGGVTVKGQFSTREFRKGDLHVETVFSLPALELVAVRLKLKVQWTDEQIEAALAAYGGEWQPVKKGIVTYWVARDGAMAISMLTWLDIQSKAIVDLTAKTLAEADAKQKAVPKF